MEILKSYRTKTFEFTCMIMLMIFAGIQLDAQSQQYLHFDKIDDFVQIDEASKYVAGADGITMTGWFYCDALAYGQGMFGFRNGGSGDGEMYMIQLHNGLLENRYISTNLFSEYVSPAFTVLPEQWQHYAWVWDGSKVSLYRDGNLVGSSPSSNSPFVSTDTPFAIGQLISPFNFYFGGRIDEVSLWSKALTESEIQDMVDNELNGDEQGLELYYKFNQGVPDGDNQSITKLICEVGDGERDGTLENFALTGTSSNFGGELDVSFQAISFPIIPDKLVTDAPFQLEAIATSGLTVQYEIVSGPASVIDNTVTLDGTVGEVIVRASQPGDGTFDPAVDVENAFMVLDPQTFTPMIDARRPLNATEVIVPNLGPVQLSTIVNIGSPGLFSVQKVEFEIDGETILAKDWGNDHYTAWWTPSAYGDVAMKIIATNNYGASNISTVNYTIVEELSSSSINAASAVHLDVNVGEQIVSAELPSFVGAYDEIIATLTIDCPSGGCDPWDRISGVEVKGHNGEWYEIIRYITPYGIACNHSVDLTDFASLLTGKVDFKFTLGTQGNGFLYTLDFEYNEGQPEYPYSKVDKIWNGTYNFGNMDELQPYESKEITLDDNAKDARVKLIATGHGWGSNNTSNAAEFYNATHHLLIDETVAFEHNNWLDCDPNPDGCNDQLGTWYHNRAGWCPGAIAPWNDFDLTAYIGNSSLDLRYRLAENYVDLCNASNPDCVSGVTCENCNDGFNPHLVTESFLISYGDTPIESGIVGLDSEPTLVDFNIFPNPATSQLTIKHDVDLDVSSIVILNPLGQQIMNIQPSLNGVQTVNLDKLASGIYFVVLKTNESKGVERLVIE